MRPLTALTILLALLCSPQPASAGKSWFVTPTGGNDANPGSVQSPFATIPHALATASAGDTVCLRDGEYLLSSTTSISRAGSPTARFILTAYPGERPILNYTTAPAGARGINLTGDYWTITGLDIHHAPDNGLHMTAGNCIIERCSFHSNGDTGLQLDGGAHDNDIINCDSYNNADASQGNADGFAAKLTVGSGNRFIGCRAWQNSDDGWDGYLRGADHVTTTLIDCWSFANGYLSDGSPSTGNGNGFKMGGSDAKDLSHDMTLIRCLATDNRVKGFDQNNNKGSMTLYQCTGFRNGTNYALGQIVDSGSTITVKNCVALGIAGTLLPAAVQATNSWMPAFTVTTDDFITTDTLGLRGARNQDGSLPVHSCLHIAAGSDLIDAGTPLGFPYNGTAPDLGCFETAGSANDVNDSRTNSEHGDFSLDQNFPNPFNPSTSISYTMHRPGHVRLVVYDMLGRETAILVSENKEAGRHAVIFTAPLLASGRYIYQMQSGTTLTTRTMLLLR